MTTELTEEVLSVRARAVTLYDQETVQKSIELLAETVTAEYRELNPVLLVALKGGCFLAAKLMEQLDFPLQMDVLQLTRYADGLTGGALEQRVLPSTELTGRHLLIVDDVLDQGLTLQGMVGFCQQHAPASIKSLVLVDKQCERAVEISADYVGLSAPDRYLFGCGMDYRGYWRNLPAIYAVAES